MITHRYPPVSPQSPVSELILSCHVLACDLLGLSFTRPTIFRQWCTVYCLSVWDWAVSHSGNCFKQRRNGRHQKNIASSHCLSAAEYPVPYGNTRSRHTSLPGLPPGNVNQRCTISARAVYKTQMNTAPIKCQPTVAPLPRSPPLPV